MYQERDAYGNIVHDRWGSTMAGYRPEPDRFLVEIYNPAERRWERVMSYVLREPAERLVESLSERDWRTRLTDTHA
jgi:hypothetical protein